MDDQDPNQPPKSSEPRGVEDDAREIDPRDERLVTIASYADPIGANIARSVLDSEGIAACLGAETTNTMLSYYGSALGGVKLMVFADQADKAKAILAAHNAADFADSTDVAQATDEDDDEEDSLQQRERDGHIRRAWHAAVLGLLLCPPLLNLYSMYLLVRHGLLVDDPHLRANWRAMAAVVVNLLALACVAGFFLLRTMMFRDVLPPTDF